MTPADLVKLARAAKSGKKVTSGLSAAKEAATISNMQQAGELPLSAAEMKRAAKAAQDDYLPGVHYADPLQAPTMKMSEALGNAGAEGKTLRFTEADRSRVFGPNRGGVGFSALQHYSIPHKEARTVWGYGKESVARKKINQGGPDSTVWTTYAGSPTQHKSNTIVVKDAIKSLQEANKAGVVSPEQIRLMNYRLQEAVSDKGKKLFPEGFDITDPKALSHATTFDRRAVISDVLMGVGVRKPMKSVEFKEANPGVVFSDASNIDNILIRETEPALANANTYDVGPHLFDIEDNIIVRPDLNEAFPYQVTGTDYGFRYEPTPIRVAAPTFTKDIPLDEAINAWKMARGSPSEFVSEEYLNFLRKHGFKKGGLAHMSGGGTPEPKRKSILDLTPLTEAAAAVQNAFKAERGTYGDKGAAMDILNRGIVADTLGGAADLANLPLQGLDWLQSKIPGLSKPASVMDVPSASPRLSDQPNTTLKFPLSTDAPFGGSEAWKELFKKSGVTSKTERPVAEISTSLLAPLAPVVASKAAKVAKAIAPRAGDLASQFAAKQAEAMGLPLEMGIVPEDKISKIALRQEPESLVKGVAPGQEMFVQHNVSTDKLIKADKLGAMPMPSLAISKTDAPLDSFGEITLIAPKEFATPSANNPIYKTDAYTKTRPYTEYKIDDKSEKNLKNVFSDVMDKVPDAEYSLDRAINEWGDKDYRDIFRAKFLNEKGLLPNKDEFKNADEFSQEMNYIVRELQPEYKDWMNNFETSLPDLGVNVKETIFKGYSPSGKRKYVPADLENIVKEMKGGAGSQNWHGVGQLRAVATPKFKNFSEIKASRSNLLSGKEMNDVKDQAANAYDDLLSRLRELSRYHADDALLEVAETRNLSALDRIYGDKITPELKADIYTYLDKLKKLPSEYFEIKPQRAVDIGEFAGAIIPADSPKVVRDILERRGVKNIHEYSTPEERKSLIKKFGKEMFAAAPVGVALKEKEEKHAKGGAVRMAEGGSVPKAPSNWTDYLSQHAQEESMRLMGGDTALNPMKDGGSINLDDMIRNAVEKANSRNYASGGAVNIDDLIQKAITLRNQHA